MAASFIYRHRLIYEGAMIFLYGRHSEARYRAVADLVSAGSSVLDLCCGPAVLYDRLLRHKRVDYTGIDINPAFVSRVDRMGGRGIRLDLTADPPLPETDYVIMQASLYHFLPDVLPIIRRMRMSAREAVIIAEPIRNLATSGVPILSAIARRQSDPGTGRGSLRFNEATLETAILAAAGRPRSASLVPGRREMVYVLEPARSDGQAARGPTG